MTDLSKQSAIDTVKNLRQKAKELNALADQLTKALDLTVEEEEEPEDVAEPSFTDQIMSTFDNRSNFRKVHDYLTEHGPSSRSDIMAATRIPIGSISAVLAADFQSVGHGIWGLKSQ